MEDKVSHSWNIINNPKQNNPYNLLQNEKKNSASATILQQTQTILKKAGAHKISLQVPQLFSLPYTSWEILYYMTLTAEETYFQQEKIYFFFLSLPVLERCLKSVGAHILKSCFSTFFLIIIKFCTLHLM